ncbi:flagellar hook-basal body complex protein [Arcobacteraceae bacterium]|nr:flagellar hook-basal body complex protein [Arcobacteraceae bacterium]
MVGALWTGISGLSGSQTGLDNESNNIANVNTIGYKASRVSFADQVYQDKIGKGVTSFDVEKQYTQGNLKVTGVSYDLALSGDGFFQVADGNDIYYTRAGNFRMGESGTLQDVGANEVQGWAVSTVTSDYVDSTDPNSSFFTSDYSKILGNKIIRDTDSIETIVSKATDYNASATSDDETIFTGAGQKTAATKTADVEALITLYNAALAVYADADPKPTSINSTTQKDLLNFPFDTTSDLTEGDEVYAYIDGVRYSTVYAGSQAKTMKNMADEISNATGFNAYLTDDVISPYDLNTDDTTAAMGYLVVEGLLPGESYPITDFGWTDSSNNTSKGNVTPISTATLGAGTGHIKSIEDALKLAVAGKQMDVYDEITIDNSETYTYQINIIDSTGTYIDVPTNALDLGTINSIDDLVTAINGNTDLAEYVEAFNINGNLVVKTNDENSDVDFTGTMTGPVTIIEAEEQTITLNGANTTSAGTIDVTIEGESLLSVAIGATDDTTTQAAAIRSAILAEGYSSVSDVTVTGGVVTIIYEESAGNIGPVVVDSTTNTTGPTAATISSDDYDDTIISSASEILKDANYSGSQGAGAEFLKITTSINQTASKSEIQLRLDSLGITDSAFGDFSVDSTGLITMKQDGVDYAVGQVAIARFTDNLGLEAVGDNLLQATARSGTAIFNTDNVNMAEIDGGSLELSTADLSESLVNLMVFQRAFEANAKSITTADAILTTLIALKR